MRLLRKLPQASLRQFFLPTSPESPQRDSTSVKAGKFTGAAKVLGSAIAGLAMLAPSPGLSAEVINVTLRSISFDIPLSDLELLADQGKVSTNLSFVEIASQPGQIESLRALLRTRFDLNPTALSQFLALPEGDILLARIGSLLLDDAASDTADTSSNAELLQETILTASVHRDGLSLINLVRQYPRERLVLDVGQVLALVSENSDFYIRRPEIIRAIQDQANLDRIPPSPQADLTQNGPFTWRKQPLTFRTPGRPSFSFADLYLPQPANRKLGNRQVEAKTPLVILSHGLGSNRRTLAYLAEHLASYGYAGLVLEHSETSSDRFNRFLSGMAAPPSASELLLRPKDVSAALDHLTERAKHNPNLAGLDLANVGIAGQSLGAYTALATGGAQINRAQLESYCPEEISRFTLNISIPLQCRILDLPSETDLTTQDTRIKAVLAINPLTSQIFGQAGIERLDVPVMVVSSSDDYVAPALPEQLQPFSWFKTTHKYLLLAHKGTHFSFIGDDGTNEVVALPEGLLGPSGKLAQPGLQAMGLAFFNRHLRGNAEYSAYLNQTYVDSLRRSPIDYSLVEDLPASLALNSENEVQ